MTDSSYYAGIDTETTGLKWDVHRFVEVYVGLYREDGVKVFEFEQRIDPQRSIAADAQRVHGIAYTDLIGQPYWDAVGPKMQKVMAKAQHFVWHNGAGFDGPFIESEFKRIGLKMPARTSTDTMLEGIWACPDGKKPRLEELCFACGVEYDPAKAHAAAYDVDTMMQCFFKAKEWNLLELAA